METRLAVNTSGSHPVSFCFVRFLFSPPPFPAPLSFVRPCMFVLSSSPSATKDTRSSLVGGGDNNYCPGVRTIDRRSRIRHGEIAAISFISRVGTRLLSPGSAETVDGFSNGKRNATGGVCIYIHTYIYIYTK